MTHPPLARPSGDTGAKSLPPSDHRRALQSRWNQAEGEGPTREEQLRARLAAHGSGEGATPPPRDLRGVKLVGADLSGMDLSGYDLSYADLSRACLKDACLARAKLRGTVLRGAELDGAEFLGADLRDADLAQAKARRTGFGRADLRRADLSAIEAEEATLAEANLERVALGGANLNGARMRDARLCHTDLTGCQLRSVDMVSAVVRKARFVGCDIRGSALAHVRDFSTASFLRADIRDVDFSGAYLLRRHILDENYLEEFRRQGRLANLVYWLWWLTSDCGRSLVRFGAWVGVFVVLFGLAYAQCPVDYGDHPTALSPYYFSLVTLSTLGYGDVLPTAGISQALVMLQVSIGYLMLAGLTAIFANKMARRAE